jgi:hypothetical protein
MASSCSSVLHVDAHDDDESTMPNNRSSAPTPRLRLAGLEEAVHTTNTRLAGPVQEERPKIAPAARVRFDLDPSSKKQYRLQLAQRPALFHDFISDGRACTMHIPPLPMAIRTDIVWAGHEALSGVVLRNQSCRPFSDFLLTHVEACHVS